MVRFLSDDFLLSNPTAIKLYHSYAAHMPIVDYHCHIDPKEIYKDRRFDNLAQVWLGGQSHVPLVPSGAEELLWLHRHSQ